MEAETVNHVKPQHYWSWPVSVDTGFYVIMPG
jgi:hypothetical protein